MTEQSISIIGGADGPTSVFIAEKLGANLINIFGLVIVALILIPNIYYAIRESENENKNKCTNKFMNILEQVGRYGSMFFMVFNLGIAEIGFKSVDAFLIYLFGSVILIIAYWLVWILYFAGKTFGKQIALAVIPTCIFLMCGLTSLDIALILFAVIFGIGHIYVTVKNRVE